MIGAFFSWIFILAIVIFFLLFAQGTYLLFRDNGVLISKIATSVVTATLGILIVPGGITAVKNSGKTTYYDATVTSIYSSVTNGQGSTSLDIVASGDSNVDLSVSCFSTKTFDCATTKLGDRVKVRIIYGFNGFSSHKDVIGKA